MQKIVGGMHSIVRREGKDGWYVETHIPDSGGDMMLIKAKLEEPLQHLAVLEHKINEIVEYLNDQASKEN